MLDSSDHLIEEYGNQKKNINLDKQLISEAYEKKTNLQGDVRKYRVWLDPNQYRMDMESRAEKGTDVGVYEHLTFINFCIISANLFRGKSRGAQQRRF